MTSASIPMSSVPLEAEQLNHRVEAEQPAWFIVLIFMMLLTALGVFVLDWLFDSKRFRIEEVAVSGQLNQVDPDRIRVAVLSTLQGNYFTTPLETIEASVASQTGVLRARVRRRWPSTLEVHVIEIQPVAFWGPKQLLNARGDLFPRKSWEGELPYLYGPEPMKELVRETFQNWHTVFASRGLSLDRLELDERELWYLTLSLSDEYQDSDHSESVGNATISSVSTGIEVIVDNFDAGARIRRLIRAFDSQLISNFGRIRSIDLRYPNGFAIRWTETAEHESMLVESD